MLTQRQLMKYFTHEGGVPNEWDDYSLNEGWECWCNDKYRVEGIVIHRGGRQEIFDTIDERCLEVSKGSVFSFYKVTKEFVE